MASILERKKNMKPATPTKKTREDYAEDALYREVWEDVNNEKTIAFFKKYSKQMIGGVLAILIIVAGYQIAVRAHRANQMAMAVNYETALEKTDVKALASIGQEGSGATADLALFQAYNMSANKDVKKLEELAEHGNTRDFRDLARLYVINLRGDEMTGQQVEKYLSSLNTKSSPFYYTGMLTIAQKYLAEGNSDAANKWLDKILSDSDCPAEITGVAQTLK